MVAASEEDEAAELVPRLASPHSFSQPREKGAAARGHSLNASAASEEDADAAVMVHRAETAHAALQSSGAKEAEGAVPEAARWQDSPAAAEVRAVLEEALRRNEIEIREFQDELSPLFREKRAPTLADLAA